MSEIHSISEFVNIELAEGIFGKPVWGFFKSRMSVHTYKRKRSYTRGERIKCSEKEFVENHTAGEKMDMDRFMGRGYVGDFWIYEKRAKEGGWPEKLIDMLKTYDPDRP